jgi:hypothetical protein
MFEIRIATYFGCILTFVKGVLPDLDEEYFVPLSGQGQLPPKICRKVKKRHWYSRHAGQTPRLPRGFLFAGDRTVLSSVVSNTLPVDNPVLLSPAGFQDVLSIGCRQCDPSTVGDSPGCCCDPPPAAKCSN